jgi:hypothetical protein
MWQSAIFHNILTTTHPRQASVIFVTIRRRRRFDNINLIIVMVITSLTYTRQDACVQPFRHLTQRPPHLRYYCSSQWQTISDFAYIMKVMDKYASSPTPVSDPRNMEYEMLEPSRTDTYGMYPYLDCPHWQSDIVPLSLGRLGRIEICRVVS